MIKKPLLAAPQIIGQHLPGGLTLIHEATSFGVSNRRGISVHTRSSSVKPKGGTLSSFFVIPRDLYATLKATNKPTAFANAILVLNELAFRVRYNGNLSDKYEIGQCICGTNELAQALGLSRQNVRTALKLLERLTIIQPTPNQQLTIVTILDKRIFSVITKHSQPAANQQLTTNIHIHKQIQEEYISKKPESKKENQRVLEKGEIERFITTISENLEIDINKTAIGRGLAAQFLKQFKNLSDAEDFIAPVWEAASRKFGEDTPSILRYLKGAMFNHVKQEMEHGN